MNTRVLTPPMADKMAELGAGVVRLAFGWDVIEPDCKGCFNWATTDAWRDEAKRTHRAIFASLAYAPAWANGGHPYRYPPLELPGLVRLRVRDRLALSRTTSFSGACGTSRTSTSTCRAPTRGSIDRW